MDKTVQPRFPLKYHLENRKLKKKIKLLEEQPTKKKTTSWCNIKQKARISEIRKQLRTHVIHQHESVEVILKVLNTLNDEQWRTEMSVMPFVGSSGVSKTYIANIIKQNYYPTYVHDVSKYDLSNNFKYTYFEVLKNLQDCCNLIILDDLNSNDIDMAARFITALPTHKVVLVIPIINTQDVEVVNKELQFFTNDKCLENVVNKFTLAGLHFKCVLFQMVDKSQLEIAIIQLMVEKRVDYTKCGHLIKPIVDGHDVATLGYKQLHTKLNVIWECGIQNVYQDNKEGL